MPEDSNLTTNRRIAASDDLEVSAYLEIAQELSGQRLDQSEPIEAHQETVLVLDFGSQYSRLIARRIREAHVYCEIIPHDSPWETVADLNPRASSYREARQASTKMMRLLHPPGCLNPGCLCWVSVTECRRWSINLAAR